MDLPSRKPTRLSGYDYAQPGAYFVTICVRDKRCLLGKIPLPRPGVDPHVVLSPMGHTVDRFLRSIPGMDKCCVMPNHVHMILKLDGTGPDVSQRIRSFKSLVTRELGEPIFQRSFHDHVIRNDADYLRIWNYIDTNPSRWQEDCFYVPDDPTHV